MKKLLKSKKALSPVVAAIILIAVTVAVSIAVAAWMGSLTIGFMETSELTVTQMTFLPSANTTTVYVTNSGTSAVTVDIVKLNGASKSFTGGADPVTIAAGGDDTITITAAAWESGNKYSISMFATDGTLMGSYTATA